MNYKNLQVGKYYWLILADNTEVVGVCRSILSVYGSVRKVFFVVGRTEKYYIKGHGPKWALCYPELHVKVVREVG